MFKNPESKLLIITLLLLRKEKKKKQTRRQIFMMRLYHHIHLPADGERSRPGTQYFISFSHMAMAQVYLGRGAHAWCLSVGNMCTVHCP